MKRFKIFIFNTSILIITSIIFRGIDIYFTSYITKKIGTELLGIYQLIMTIYLFGITLATSGINLSVTRVISEELAKGNTGSVKQIMKKCLYITLTTSIFTSILISFNSDFIISKCLHNKVSNSVIYLFCLALPPIAMSSAISGYFAGVRRIYKNAIGQFFEHVAKVIVTMFLLSLFLPKGIEYACFSLILGDLISEILSFIYIFTIFSFDKRRYPSLETVNKLYEYNHYIANPHATNPHTNSHYSSNDYTDKHYTFKHHTDNNYTFRNHTNNNYAFRNHTDNNYAFRNHTDNNYASNHYTYKILRISIPVAITSYIRSGLSTFKQLIIPTSLEKSGINSGLALSNYGIINGMALPIIMFPDILVKTFASLLVPEFSRYHAKKDYKRTKQITSILLLCIIGGSIFLCLFLFVFSNLLGKLIYNDIRSRLLYKDSFTTCNFYICRYCSR